MITSLLYFYCLLKKYFYSFRIITVATGLNRDVYAPKAVTDVDWIDTLWPLERRVRGDFPHVQKYCLCGMAGSYTDFHLDFGGTSVW